LIPAVVIIVWLLTAKGGHNLRLTTAKSGLICKVARNRGHLQSMASSKPTCARHRKLKFARST